MLPFLDARGGDMRTSGAAILAMVAVWAAMAQPQKKYPAHWWTPVDDAGKPGWEILPQAAKPGEVILSKRNELGIFSNFAATPFRLHGKRYASRGILADDALSGRSR